MRKMSGIICLLAALVLTNLAGTGAAMPLFSEDFESYTPENWVISSGSWSIEVDTQKDGNSGKVVSGDAASTTNTIYTKETFSTGISACTDTRLANTNPYWHRGIGLEWGSGASYRAFYFQYRGDTNELMLDKINFGTWDTILRLQTTSDSLKTSWDRICLEANGSNLKAILNDQQIFSIQDNDLLSSSTYRVALMAGSSHSHFDNVVVTSLYDVVIPSISFSSPYNGQSFTTNSITVSGIASDDTALSKVEVKVSTGSWQLASGTTSWSKSVTLSSGSNTIYARASDSSGNTNEASVTVTYSDSAPSISISSPSTGQTFTTNSITVSGTASDDIALSKVEVKIGSGSWQLASGTTSWSKSVTLSTGSNTITARATDSSGNTNEASVIVTYNPSNAPGLVGTWHFDGNAQDSSGNGNHGTINGATFVQGINGQALSFDGVDDYVDIGDNPSLRIDGPYTVEAWVYSNKNNIGQILSKSRLHDLRNYELLWLDEGNGGPRIKFEFSINGVTYWRESQLLKYKEWYYVAGVYDGTYVKLYINGAQAAITPASGIVDVSTQPLTIGRRSDGVRFFNGIIDEVRIYNRALSASEIKANYNADFASPAATANILTPTQTKTSEPQPQTDIKTPPSVPPPPPYPIESEPDWTMIGGIGALILLGIIAITKLRSRNKKEKHDESIPPATPSTFPQELETNYSNVELIGEGGFARVFKAKRKSDGKVVAVKIPISLDEATGKSFLKEIKAWEELKHPNIVELYDMNIMPLPYFEMEYVDNRSIEELKKPIEVERAARIVFDISEGLKYAHSRGIIHRDLKPHNVLLTKDLIPKITDWGLSKVLAESKTSSVAGFSPVYAAPEQVSPKQFGRADARTDIYQLGTIFYELVAGRLPFGGDSLAEISSAIINEKPAPSSTLNPGARDVEHIILKCLAKNQGERYQSVQELQKALADFLKLEYKESLKESTRKRDITKSRLFCGDLVLISAKIGDYTEVLKYLSILKDYAKPEESTDIENLMNELDYRLKEGIEPGDDFSEKIKILAYRVQMK